MHIASEVLIEVPKCEQGIGDVITLPESPRLIAGVKCAAVAVWPFTAARQRHLPPPEAHEAYLKGRFFLDQRSSQGWQQALEQFERAVALDARDPAAHAGLADTYAAMSDFGVASPVEMRPRAMHAVQRALALDPGSAEGQEALGRAQFLFDWNFTAAERSLERALAIDPDYMPAYQAMAWLQSARGEYAAAALYSQMMLYVGLFGGIEVICRYAADENVGRDSQ